MAIVAAASSPPGFNCQLATHRMGRFCRLYCLSVGLMRRLVALLRREEDNIALVLSSLVLVVTLPIVAYSFVRFFALR